MHEDGRRVEWPTLALAFAIYGGWGLLTFYHDRLPLPLLLAAGAWLIAWHGSLQHETIHGHPTRSAMLNALIGGLPLSLWLPYARYRRDHIAHHATDHITDPYDDPESHYLPNRPGLAAKARLIVARSQATLAGRLLLGPFLIVLRFFWSEASRLRREPVPVLRDWMPHIAGVMLILAWLAVCRLDLRLYLFGIVYPGIALTLLRSFAEHRAAQQPGHRVAVVEHAGPLGLLYLNNNLHAAHHAFPGASWYDLPALYRARRTAILADNGGLLYQGYGEIVRRFWRRPQDDVIHPDWRT